VDEVRLNGVALDPGALVDNRLPLAGLHPAAGAAAGLAGDDVPEGLAVDADLR
jgi:hypothetical protein